MNSSDNTVWLSSAFEERILSIATRLTDARQTLAVVECTIGGAIGHLMTNVPGASTWFLGGIAPYSARFKESALGLAADAFAGHGSVSPEAARLLATAMRDRTGADWTLAETGLAGPRGNRRSIKPTGTVYVCLIDPNGQAWNFAHETGLDDREKNKCAFIGQVIEILDRSISK